MTNPNDQNPGQGGGGGGATAVALMQLAGGLYDSYQNRKQSRENIDRTAAAQKAESELAYQRSVEMWNAQNLYNTPEQQMARFSAGGLNPNLIYGQGSAGNASSPPQYQPANLQYKYEAPTYGANIQAIMPTLMAVGTWMQNMRLTETQIQKGTTETERSRQMIDYLLQANPKLLTNLDNRLSLFPYQSSMQRSLAGQAEMKVADMNQDFRYKYGDRIHDLFGTQMTPEPLGGVRKLQYAQEYSKTKLLDAKSSWTDYDITDPQAIMQMVFSGIMGLAGQTIKLSTHRTPGKTTRFKR